tara:strand:+ start:1464 stop:1634 length:171 start_codon:yes stop_codon:yes gene_type:complete
MNISEFERSKPKKTLRAIKDFEEVLYAHWENGEKEISIELASEYLKKIKHRFISGD